VDSSRGILVRQEKSKIMKNLYWIGIVLLVLGVASLLFPIPHTEREGVKAGGISLGVETRHEERLSAIVGGLMIAGGAAMMIASRVVRPTK
jgi:hypothetical protein